jgi:D-alanyl-D-alanine carboxypeptidase
MSIKLRLEDLLGAVVTATVLTVGLITGVASAQPTQSLSYTVPASNSVSLTPLYKMWNPTATDHYYANSWNDALSAGSSGWQYQGITCNISAMATSHPLYQLWNAAASDHLYTASWSEALNAISSGWQYERIVGYLGGNKPLYRMWNPAATDHYDTASWTDVLGAANSGWHYEGITGYCW